MKRKFIFITCIKDNKSTL